MAEQNVHQYEKQNTARPLIDQAVRQALEAHVPKLQARIVQQVMEALPQQGSLEVRSNGASPSRADAGSLLNAITDIHAGGTQKEVLRALLNAGSEYCSRIALFVVKAGAATGWQSRGFGSNEAIKDFSLDLNIGPAAQTYQKRTATPGKFDEMGGEFAQHFGAPAGEQMLVLPLALKEKVAALVYADGGESGKLDAAALELLVLATSAWLEVASLRKQAAKEEAGISRSEAAVQPMQATSSYPDPFSAPRPMHIPPSQTTEAEPAAEVVEVAAAHAAGAAAAPAAATDPLAGLSPEDADVHRKAQRFARLLVDEIKLYNQAKVAEGRRNKDLYDRLKDDIDKSRGTFEKRYGSTAAVSGDYFQHELLRSLAEDDISIMGSNFRR
jgi:hypothetical protein